MAYGPIELLVLEHDGSDVPAASIGALTECTRSGLIAIVDIVLVTHEADGSIQSRELRDINLELRGSLDPIVDEVAGLVSSSDLEDIGEAVGPGRSALVVVIEHRWPGRLDAAVRDAGGTLSLHLRIPRDAVDEVVRARSAAAS
jgi:uncharacterized membrane protein